MAALQNRTPEVMQKHLQMIFGLRSMGVITRGILLNTICPGCGKFGAFFSMRSSNGFHKDKNCMWHGKLTEPGVLDRLIALSKAATLADAEQREARAEAQRAADQEASARAKAIRKAQHEAAHPQLPQRK